MLSLISKSQECSLYSYNSECSDLLDVFISTTKESRAIVNDPFLYGLEYTEALKKACENTLCSLRDRLSQALKNSFNEDQACVLNILRGGLNFGLREAVGTAYGWNRHSSAFLSAQRARDNNDPEHWYITESAYKKVYLPDSSLIIFGDVVATGTSLEFALNEILEIAHKEKRQMSSFLFFTIGGPRSHEILRSISSRAKQLFPDFKKAYVVYFEGCFKVADENTPVSIKLTGTDLLRRESILAPEFIQSQFESPSYPIERCTIYDAGSRAFWIPEYLEDVREYWEQTLELARQGMTYRSLVGERFPELKTIEEEGLDLLEISKSQIDKCSKTL